MRHIYSAGELGLSSYKISTLIKNGELIRLKPDCYVWASLPIRDLASAILEAHPTWVVTELTAVQLYEGRNLTLPLMFRGPRTTRQRETPIYVVLRRGVAPWRQVQGMRVAAPVVAMLDAFPRTGSKFLAEQYRGRKGKAQFRMDLEQLGKIPSDFRTYLNQLSIGADSRIERKLFDGLVRRGLEFEQNVFELGYWWDFRHATTKRLLIEVGAALYHRPDTSHSSVEFDASAEQYIKDVWKMNQALVHGKIVLQFTARCIDHELERCLDLVECTLEQLRGGAKVPEMEPPWHWHKGYIYGVTLYQ